MPQLAAFPKGFMDELVVTGSMSLARWIEMAATLDIDGLEFYSGFADLQDPEAWPDLKLLLEDHALDMPMLCCSPDFTHPDPAFRAEQVAKEKSWIEMAAAFGGTFCRVLSGQRRPELSLEQGLDYAAESIRACLPHAADHGVTLILENHYKDNYWQYPEFAQQADVFCKLVERIDGPNFGVNFDPSNTLLAGEDPLALLERVKHRVVTMHASDRYLAEGTLEDLKREEGSVGYAKRLAHGVIGKGMNDYDKIFRTLADVGFDGWVSIEDGVNGMDDLRASVSFLRKKMDEYWPE
jgi:sugar phosphate isomerase/epimerase